LRRRHHGVGLAWIVPLQNRVTPLGDLIVARERGLVYGNRGCLHDATGTIRRRYATRRWIACQLQFRGRRRTQLLAPGRNGSTPVPASVACTMLPTPDLPDGAFVLHDGKPCVVVGRWLLTWSPGGYRERQRRPVNGHAVVMTPPSLVALLGSGWTPLVPLLHPTADAGAVAGAESSSDTG
jgi:hypothetical protein